MTVRIFSYGTLQLESVQRALFGRLVAMEEDVLTGFAAIPIEIGDPQVLAHSGTAIHLALVPAGDGAAIPGRVLAIEEADLPAVDDYEGDNYRRIEVPLASGSIAWVYVKA
jgi:gamma-glutamylcyclotransferase (GGCT)/AIG2-like uncharacterized protein YtfP